MPKSLQNQWPGLTARLAKGAQAPPRKALFLCPRYGGPCVGGFGLPGFLLLRSVNPRTVRLPSIDSERRTPMKQKEFDMPQQRSYLPAIDSIVRLNGDKPTTTSLIIAEKFSKRHRDVLRQISVIVNHPGYTEISERNFAPANYTDQQGKNRPYYEITRDGFTLLAMSFTGHEAMRFKLRFIDAFNRLERDMLERLPQLEAENHSLRYALLTRNPRWSAIVRYQCMGLKQVEIAKLLGLSTSTVRCEQREMEALGVVPQGEHPQLSLLAGGES